MPEYCEANIPNPMIKFLITLRLIKAKMGERSKPPIGGITPLNTFRYGSVIENRLTRIGLLVSRFGNQVSKILMISR